MENKLISIIIPVFNCKKSLEKLLDSILMFENEKYEIIIVDDGSTDGSTDLETKYKNCVKIIKQENKGVSAARNNGIKHAIGKYIMFADSDDTINFDIISDIYNKLQNNDYKLLTFGYSTMNNGKLIECINLENSIGCNNIKELFFETLNTGVYWMAVWNKIYKSDIVKEICFDYEYFNGEDFDFNIKYLRKINFQGVKIINKLLYNYNICPGQFKYRQNSINTRLKIYNELIQLDDLHEYNDLINYYFWNCIFYDFIALYKTNRLSKAQKYEEIKVLKSNQNFNKLYTPKSLGLKKRVFINIIKFNPYLGYILLGKLKK